MTPRPRPPIRLDAYCPACGQRTLIAHSDGMIRCSRDDCPHYLAANELLQDHETGHLVRIGLLGWIIRHPLIERLNDGLFGCEVHADVATNIESHGRPPFGTYRIARDPIRSIAWKRIEDQP